MRLEDRLAPSSGPASQLVVTLQPSATATAGVAFATQPVVKEEDASGNVITTDSTHTVTVALGNLGTGSLQGGPLTVMLVNGVATFSGLSHNVAQTINLSFTTNAGPFTATSSNIVVSPAAASKLVYTTVAQTLTAGVVSGTQTVQEQDAFGNATTAAETVHLSTSNAATGLFKDNATGLTTITSVTIAAGSSTASFKYVDTRASTPTLTAAAVGLSSARQTETVSAAPASKLVYTTAAQTLTAGVVSGTMTVQEQDAFGNATTTAESVHLSTSNAATGLFKDNATGLATITSVAIAAGSSTASFKYVDTLRSTPTLSAAATGLTAATQVEAVVYAVIAPRRAVSRHWN